MYKKDDGVLVGVVLLLMYGLYVGGSMLEYSLKKDVLSNIGIDKCMMLGNDMLGEKVEEYCMYKDEWVELDRFDWDDMRVWDNVYMDGVLIVGTEIEYIEMDDGSVLIESKHGIDGW
jgi:hypothetical protein